MSASFKIGGCCGLVGGSTAKADCKSFTNMFASTTSFLATMTYLVMSIVSFPAALICKCRGCGTPEPSVGGGRKRDATRCFCVPKNIMKVLSKGGVSTSSWQASIWACRIVLTTAFIVMCVCVTIAAGPSPARGSTITTILEKTDEIIFASENLIIHFASSFATNSSIHFPSVNCTPACLALPPENCTVCSLADRNSFICDPIYSYNSTFGDFGFPLNLPTRDAFVDAHGDSFSNASTPLRTGCEVKAPMNWEESCLVFSSALNTANRIPWPFTGSRGIFGSRYACGWFEYGTTKDWVVSEGGLECFARRTLDQFLLPERFTLGLLGTSVLLTATVWRYYVAWTSWIVTYVIFAIGILIVSAVLKSVLTNQPDDDWEIGNQAAEPETELEVAMRTVAEAERHSVAVNDQFPNEYDADISIKAMRQAGASSLVKGKSLGRACDSSLLLPRPDSCLIFKRFKGAIKPMNYLYDNACGPILMLLASPSFVTAYLGFTAPIGILTDDSANGWGGESYPVPLSDGRYVPGSGDDLMWTYTLLLRARNALSPFEAAAAINACCRALRFAGYKCWGMGDVKGKRESVELCVGCFIFDLVQELRTVGSLYEVWAFVDLAFSVTQRAMSPTNGFTPDLVPDPADLWSPLKNLSRSFKRCIISAKKKLVTDLSGPVPAERPRGQPDHPAKKKSVCFPFNSCVGLGAAMSLGIEPVTGCTKRNCTGTHACLVCHGNHPVSVCGVVRLPLELQRNSVVAERVRCD